MFQIQGRAIKTAVRRSGLPTKPIAVDFTSDHRHTPDLLVFLDYETALDLCSQLSEIFKRFSGPWRTGEKWILSDEELKPESPRSMRQGDGDPGA